MLERFKIAYQQAANNNQDRFTFDGNSFITHYAKYLIQYLDAKLYLKP